MGWAAPPGVAFTYAPGRRGQYADTILQGFTDILQVDSYARHNRLIQPERASPATQLAYCWAHARCKHFEVARNCTAPIAAAGLKRITELYKIETEIKGLASEAGMAIRQDQSAPPARPGSSVR